MYLAGSGSAVIRTSKFRNGWNLSDAQGASRFAAAPLRRDRGRPLKLRSLEPASGLLGKEYAKEAESESDYHLHVRATDARGDGEVAEGPWRVSLGAVDGWALRASADTNARDDRGPFDRLLGNS